MKRKQAGASGKLLILGLLCIATLAASFAWWHQRSRGRRAIQFWGARPAYLIRHADSVRVIFLERPIAEHEFLPTLERKQVLVHGVAWQVASQRDIGQARGLIHAQQALIEDSSFDWASCEEHNPPINSDVVWDYGLAFQEGEDLLLVVFDKDEHWIGAAHRVARVRLQVGIGLTQFLEEQSSGITIAEPTIPPKFD